jgi:hypothetical protein
LAELKKDANNQVSQRPSVRIALAIAKVGVNRQALWSADLSLNFVIDLCDFLLKMQVARRKGITHILTT